MIKRLLFFLLAISVVSGCTDSCYLAEKLFYQAEQKVKKIVSGRVQLQEDDYERIIAAYRVVSDRCPLEEKTAQAQFIISKIYISQGKYEEAKRELKTIIHNFSSKPVIASQAQFAIGQLYESQGNWESAEQEYEKLSDLYPLTPLGLNMPIYTLLHYRAVNKADEEEKTYVRGIRHYNKLLEDFLGTKAVPLIQDYLATLHYQRGKLNKAIEVWEEIIKKYPRNPFAVKAFLAVGETYANRIKDIPKAINVYEKFIKNYPQDGNAAKANLKLAELYLENSQIKKAKKIYAKILKDYSDKEELLIGAHLGLAQCYKKEANVEKVIGEYNLIREYYPKSKVALAAPFSIARYYLEIKANSKAEKAFKEAINEYKKILEDDQRSVEDKKEAAGFLALCYLNTREWDEALALLRVLADKYPQEPMYLLDIAAIYRNLNSLDKAINVYKEIIRKYSHNQFLTRLAKAQIGVLTTLLEN